MIKKNLTRKLIYHLFLFNLFFICPSSMLPAGNKVLVDDRVKELDELNKGIVKGLPCLPKDGHVDLKANLSKGTWTVSFDILGAGTSTSNVKSGNLSFGNNRTLNDPVKQKGARLK